MTVSSVTIEKVQLSLMVQRWKTIGSSVTNDMPDATDWTIYYSVNRCIVSSIYSK